MFEKLDLAAIKALFPDGLPATAGEFFSHREARKLVPGYGTIRQAIHGRYHWTNNKLYGMFKVAVESAGEAVPPLAFSKNLVKTQAATVGQDVSFSILVSGGKAPYTYKWYYGDTLIDSGVNSTAATPTLVNHAVELASAGAYKAIVTDSAGANITSNVCQLTVNAAPEA